MATKKKSTKKAAKPAKKTATKKSASRGGKVIRKKAAPKRKAVKAKIRENESTVGSFACLCGVESP